MTLRKSEIAAFLLLLWAALSLLWTPDQWQGLFQLSHALLAISGFLLVSRLPENAVRYAVLSGALLALLGHFVLLSLLPTDWYGGFGNKNFGAEFVMAAVPLVAVSLWQSRLLRYLGIAAALAGIAVLFTVYGQAHAKYVALLVLGGCLAVWLIWKRAYLLAGIIVLVPIDAMVLLGYNAWSISSLRTRIELWTNTIALWLEKPLLGHGFGSFNYEYPRFQEYHLSFFPEMGTLLNQPGMFSGSAHSEPLQLLAELGLIGFLLASGFVAVLLRERFRPGALSPVDYGCLASLALVLGSGIVGFPLQNPATIALAVIALGLLARHERPILLFRANRLVRLGLSLPVAASLVAVSWLHFESRAYFTQVKAGMENNDIAGAFVANLRAVQKFPWDWLPKYQFPLTLTALAVHDRKSTIEHRAADQVFALGQEVSPHAPILKYSRIAYLDSSNRVDETAGEIEAILQNLKDTASLQPPTWLAELWFAQRSGDLERAAFARIVASDPMVMRHAGHDYPAAYREFLNSMARDTREIIEKGAP